jgi:hypothetical protein
MLCIIQRGRWCDVIVLAVCAPTEDKCGDKRNSFYEELNCVFDQFPKYHMKLLWDISLQKCGGKIFSNRQFRMSLLEAGNDNGVG